MENAVVIIVIVFGLIILLLATNMWIAAAVGMVGVFVLASLVGGGAEGMIGIAQFNMVRLFIWIAIPLFIFMGEIILKSGLSTRVYKGATAWIGFLPGGLLHTNIATCAIFSAASGSSMATAATIGTVAIPEMTKRGYDRKLILGSLASGGTLGILIPPSITMVIYGAFVQESIGKLFIAGIIPGVILAGLFMGYIALAVTLNPHLVPERIKPSLKAMASGIVDILPVGVLVFMVLGTIYFGVATPTEAAAMGAFAALVFCALYRRLTWQVFKEAAVGAIKITSWVMLIVIGARLVSMGVSLLKVPAQLSEMLFAAEVSSMVVLAALVIMYIILGCFLDPTSMMLLTLPIVYPVMMSLGFDGIWLGIFMVIMTEMALVTPPVGLNLYVIYGLTGEKYLGDIIRGVIPFLVCMIIMVILLAAFPWLAMWLPRQMAKKF